MYGNVPAAYMLLSRILQKKYNKKVATLESEDCNVFGKQKTVYIYKDKQLRNSKMYKPLWGWSGNPAGGVTAKKKKNYCKGFVSKQNITKSNKNKRVIWNGTEVVVFICYTSKFIQHEERIQVLQLMSVKQMAQNGKKAKHTRTPKWPRKSLIRQGAEQIWQKI